MASSAERRDAGVAPSALEVLDAALAAMPRHPRCLGCDAALPGSQQQSGYCTACLRGEGPRGRVRPGDAGRP